MRNKRPIIILFAIALSFSYLLYGVAQEKKYSLGTVAIPKAVTGILIKLSVNAGQLNDLISNAEIDEWVQSADTTMAMVIELNGKKIAWLTSDCEWHIADGVNPQDVLKIIYICCYGSFSEH